ncbi:MAG: secretin N-terminal domain-containing protein [Oceanipulchritudo sp.]
MKGPKLLPLLASMLISPLFAQERADVAAPVAALEEARSGIEDAEDTQRENEAEVLEAAEAGSDASEEAEAEEEPVFELPEDEVSLDMPGSAVEGSMVTTDSETISVDFPEEDVRDIIRSVADLYELNVVIPDGLTGSVSIKLRDVTWQQVFNVVLEPLNFTYITDDNIIKIKSQDELAMEPVDTRVFIVDFAKAGEIQGSVEPLVDTAAGGRIQVDTRSNALVITERPSRMNDIQEIIEILDRPTEQVMIESKFVEITGREEDSIGVDWQSMIGYRMQAGPMERTYERVDSRTSTPRMSSENDFSISNTNGQTTTSLSQSNSDESVTEWIDGITKNDTAVFSADAFSVVLSALETNTDIELVSNPTIVTMNNKQAQINIGEEYPIPEYTYNDERGTFEVSNFEFKPIGVNLSVIPQINSAGFINLDIQPEISSRTGSVQFGGASGAEIPIITVRKTDSSVTIKSGYTLAIGGLIQTDSENNSSKVPVLGDIPGLGRLFSSTGKQIDKRNLIVFITAKILSASGATYEDVFSEKTLYEMGITERDVPGYELPDEEKEMLDEIQRSRNEVDRLKDELELQSKVKALESMRQTSTQSLQEEAGSSGDDRVIRRRYQ